MCSSACWPSRPRVLPSARRRSSSGTCSRACSRTRATSSPDHRPASMRRRASALPSRRTRASCSSLTPTAGSATQRAGPPESPFRAGPDPRRPPARPAHDGTRRRRGHPWRPARRGAPSRRNDLPGRLRRQHVRSRRRHLFDRGPDGHLGATPDGTAARHLHRHAVSRASNARDVDLRRQPGPPGSGRPPRAARQELIADVASEAERLTASSRTCWSSPGWNAARTSPARSPFCCSASCRDRGARAVAVARHEHRDDATAGPADRPGPRRYVRRSSGT